MILVDTNVLLDNYLPFRSGWPMPPVLQAREEGGATPQYPSAIVRDVFHVIDADLKRERRLELEGELPESDALSIREMAWASVDNMRELGAAVSMDESDLWLACKYRKVHRDLEDYVVLAAVKRASMDYLMTSDQQLLRHAMGPALCPADMSAGLEVEMGQTLTAGSVDDSGVD